MQCRNGHRIPSRLVFCPLCHGRPSRIIGRMERQKADRALRYLLEEVQAGRKIRDDLIRDYHDSLEATPPRPVKSEPLPGQERAA